MLNVTTISSKGQIVIPKSIRDSLGLKSSDPVGVRIESGKIIVEPLSPIDEVYGMFKAKKVITKKDIKKEFDVAIAQKNVDT